MKVLVLSNCAADPYTGSGAVISFVIEELRHAGAVVDFFHLQMVGIAGSTRGARYLAPVRAWVHASRLLRKNSYDLVVCFGGEWGLLTWATRSTRGACRLLQYSNGVESHAAAALRTARRRPGFPRPRWFQRGDLSVVHDLSFRYADHVAVVSQFDARYAREVLKLPAESVTTLATPLPDYFLGIPFEPTRAPIVGYCGNWTPIKNPSLIRQDVEAFLRAFPDWSFEAVGSGTETLALSGGFGGDVVPRVRGLGRVPREQLPVWYQRCSIVLLPSVYESFGLAAAEAMACGSAVVGSPNSAFAASLEHGDEVYLLKTGRSPELAHALAELAGNPDLRTRIAQGGQRRAQRLSSATWRASFHAMLARILKR